MKHNNDGFINCPVSTAQKIIGGKWTILILYHLSKGILRFGELNRLMPSMTQSTLTKELRSLESYHLIKRKVYPEVPPKVEYSLTEIGIKLLPVIEGLAQWGNEYKEYVKYMKKTGGW
ncbi:MAG: winged helix-turn-helix transcriptional regulator [Peptococcaceae bacterium]